MSLLTSCHGALSLSKAQLSDLNVCWSNLIHEAFPFLSVEICSCFINGIGKLDFLHLSKLITAKFFKHLSISSNVALRQVFYCYTVYGDRFLQLFHELNLQLEFGLFYCGDTQSCCSYFNRMCDCVIFNF